MLRAAEQALRRACCVTALLFSIPLAQFRGSFDMLLFQFPVTDWDNTTAVAETPEIKLFGKWSTDDVQINDISLQVSS